MLRFEQMRYSERTPHMKTEIVINKSFIPVSELEKRNFCYNTAPALEKNTKDEDPLHQLRCINIVLLHIDIVYHRQQMREINPLLRQQLLRQYMLLNRYQ